MHDRQIIGIVEVNVQFGHGLAQKGGREKKKAATGHPYKCDVSCTNRFQCVMWPWVSTNCISSFHHNIQAAKRATRSPSVCRPRGCHRRASTPVIVMTSYGNMLLIFLSGRMQTCGLLEGRTWCKLRTRVTQTETACRDDGGVEYLFIIRSANLQQMLPEPAGTYKSYFCPPPPWGSDIPVSNIQQP